MRLIGICGRSGCGKSIFGDILRNKGFLVIDCDAVYREMVSAPSACLFELETAFGADIVVNNSLDRKKLASIVFVDSEKLALLNRITHKHILNRVNELISEYKESKPIFLDAPTLFESGLHDRCELIVSVIASDEICLERIKQRDGLTDEKAIQRLNNQKTNEFLIENSDIIIYNEGTAEDFETAVITMLEEIIS